MKTLFASCLIGLAVFIYLGGSIPLPKFGKAKRKICGHFKSNKENQEFLEYLWFLKSELSTGVNIANVDLNVPDHRLANRVNLIFALAVQTGTAVTPSLNRFIKQAKNEIELKQEIESELASTKATVYILACLPIFGLALGNLLNGNSIGWLVGTSIGRIYLLLAIALNLLGILWINRLIKRSLIA